MAIVPGRFAFPAGPLPSALQREASRYWSPEELGINAFPLPFPQDQVASNPILAAGHDRLMFVCTFADDHLIDLWLNPCTENGTDLNPGLQPFYLGTALNPTTSDYVFTAGWTFDAYPFTVCRLVVVCGDTATGTSATVRLSGAS